MAQMKKMSIKKTTADCLARIQEALDRIDVATTDIFRVINGNDDDWDDGGARLDVNSALLTLLEGQDQMQEAINKHSSMDKSTKKSKSVKKMDYLEQMESLYDQLGGFINRGDFAEHGMMIGREPDGSISLDIWDVNDNNYRDSLRFTINIAKDGMEDDWTVRQWVDNREGYIVDVVRTHPTRGNMVLESRTRVDGGFRSLTAFIRKYVRQFEEEVEAENKSGLGFSRGEEFEDYSYYASTKKSKSVKKEYDENVFDEKLKQALIDRGINVTSIERFIDDGDYIVTVADWNQSTRGALEQCFKKVLPCAYEPGMTPSEYEYRCLDEMISQSDWWVDKSTKKSMKEQSFSEMVDARRRLNRKG